MAKQVITVGGEDREVREDTAKSYRGVVWALVSIFAFVIIAAIVFFIFFAGSVADGDLITPAESEQQRR